MNQAKKIYELIGKAKQAIKDGDVEKAVSADSALTHFSTNTLSQIKSTFEQHSAQYNFIAKFRIINTIKDLSLFLASIVSFAYGWTMGDTYGYVSMGLGTILFFIWLSFSNRMKPAFRMMREEETKILNDRLYVHQTEELIRIINQYQKETFDQMTPLYERYEEMNQEKYMNQSFASILKQAQEAEAENGDEDEEETHS